MVRGCPAALIKSLLKDKSGVGVVSSLHVLPDAYGKGGLLDSSPLSPPLVEAEESRPFAKAVFDSCSGSHLFDDVVVVPLDKQLQDDLAVEEEKPLLSSPVPFLSEPDSAAAELSRTRDDMVSLVEASLGLELLEAGDEK